MHASLLEVPMLDASSEEKYETCPVTSNLGGALMYSSSGPGHCAAITSAFGAIHKAVGIHRIYPCWPSVSIHLKCLVLLLLLLPQPVPRPVLPPGMVHSSKHPLAENCRASHAAIVAARPSPLHLRSQSLMCTEGWMSQGRMVLAVR